MANYIIRRLFSIVPTLALVSMVSFLLIELPPGNVADAYMARLAEMDEAEMAMALSGITARYGLDKPVYVRYLLWIAGFVRGDFGYSILYSRDVASLIGERLIYTVILAFSTLAFTWIVGLPIGVYSATHQYAIGDHLLTLMAFVGRSIPNFLLALVLMILGATVFDTSVGGFFSNRYIDAPWSLAKLGDFLAHLWVPIIVIGTDGTASITRIMRGNLLDALNLQYVTTARAKGVRESRVVYKYAVRNTIQPLIMAFGMQFPDILSGATIVSIVLSLPTLGPLLFNALTSQDMYVAGTILFFQVLLLVVGNFLADLALAWVDPRISYD